MELCPLTRSKSARNSVARPFAEEMGGRESGREGCRSDGALAPPWRWALAQRKEREMTAVVAREKRDRTSC